MWIPKEELSSEDRLSKIIDHDDCRTTTPAFEIHNNFWGPLTIGRFADHENSQTRKFNS